MGRTANILGMGLGGFKLEQGKFHANVHVAKNSNYRGSGKHVYLQILQGEDLPGADVDGKSDPYCIVEYAGKPVGKTDWVARTTHPVWGGGRGEMFCFPHTASHNEIVVKVKDHDTIGRDDFLGTVVIQLDMTTPPYEDNPLDRWTTLDPTGASGSGGPGAIRWRLATGLQATPSQMAPIKTEATEYIYVICLQGAGLRALDNSGLADVYCRAKVNTGGPKRQTQVCRNTVNPKWTGENMSFVKKRHTHKVRVKILDDRMTGDGFMGEVWIDLHKLTKNGVKWSLQPGERLDAWYQVVPNSRHAAQWHGKDLGQLKIRLGCGYLKSPPMSLNMRPSWRIKMGTLKVSVIGAAGLKIMDDLSRSTDPFVKILFEGREESTNVALRTLNPTWNQAWEFDVTEITSDILFLVYDESLNGEALFGMASVPLLTLLEGGETEKADVGERKVLDTWIQLMRPPEAGTQFHKLKRKAKKPLGFLHVQLKLHIKTSVRNSYMYQQPYPKEDVVNTVDVSTLLSSVARLVNALLSPLTSYLACLLYLQKWKEPVLNLSILLGVLLMWLFIFPLVDLILPLQIGVWLLLQGHILARLRQYQLVPLHKEQHDSWYQATKERTKLHLQRVLVDEVKAKDVIRAQERQKLKASQKQKGFVERMELMRKDSDSENDGDTPRAQTIEPNAELEWDEDDGDDKQIQEKKRTLLQRVGKKLKNMLHVINISQQFERLKAPLRNLQNTLGGYSDTLEKVGNVFNQKDKELSMLAFPYVLCFSLVFSVIWMVLVILQRAVMFYSPIGQRHFILLMWLILVIPTSRYMEEIIAAIDQYLMLMPIEIELISHGSLIVIERNLKKKEQDIANNKEKLRKQVLKEMAAEDARKEHVEKQNARYVDATVFRESEQRMLSGPMFSAQWFKAHVQVPYFLFLRSPVNREFYHREVCNLVLYNAPAEGAQKVPQRTPEDLRKEEDADMAERRDFNSWFNRSSEAPSRPQRH